MKKKEFLNRLSVLLDVLQEEELKDILNEYEQHIDMKMEEGLSEEEAIEDFGSVEELSEDILSAYHVKSKTKEKRIPHFWKTGILKGKKLCLKPSRSTKRIKTKSRMKKKEEKRKMNLKNTVDGIVGGSIHLIRQGWNLCFRTLFACIFFCNAMIGLITLFVVGLLVVMLFTGYPVIGITIGAVGVAMAVNAVACYAAIKMRRK